MAKRPPQAQSQHDSVIATRARLWKGDSRCSQSWTNSDDEQNGGYELNGKKLYPDIIVKLADEKGTRYGLEEVETADSVNANEVQQWRDYAALGKAFFNLLVPADEITEAKKLAKGLAVSVVGYSKTAGGYTFTKGEAA
jgi:hypothetical protein